MTMIDAAPSGTLRKLESKRARPQDDLLADYIKVLVRPGDRTLQLGRSQFGSVCLARGAFHEILAAASDVQALERDCARRSVSIERLCRDADDSARRLDLAILGRALGFSGLGGQWRRIASRLKVGGVLVLVGADRGAMTRLADALFMDPDWAFEDMIGGDAAVFRKIRAGECLTEIPAEDNAADTGQQGKTRLRASSGFVSGLIRTLFRR
ncbi:MAG: hypothetical protein GYB36_02270 [Alphaproteobacteria bacterium]|nr:hypothetical protein [Alphaproteobacteria bacterium]